MNSFTGTLAPEGVTESQAVYGQWWTTTRGYVPGWAGWVRAEDDNPIPRGDSYTLTLDDGKVVAIRILSASRAAAGGTRIPFNGNGPAPA